MNECTNKQLEELLEEAQVGNMGWTYHLYNEDEEYVYVEMDTYSPLGEDFTLCFNFEKDDPIHSFVKCLREYWEEFDPDDHAAMWIENRGNNGIPDSIEELVDDAIAIRDMIYDVILALEAKENELFLVF